MTFDGQDLSNFQETGLKKLILAVAFVLFSGYTILGLSCSFDTDCQPGSKCVKPSGSIYGVCAGGLFPGNKNDSQPVTNPLDINGTFGNTCSFDTDCGPGSSCMKKQGSIYGVCINKR